MQGRGERGCLPKCLRSHCRPPAPVSSALACGPARVIVTANDESAAGTLMRCGLEMAFSLNLSPRTLG